MLPAVVMGRFQHRPRAALDQRSRRSARRHRGQAHRHPLLHADDRHLGARHLPARIRRRPEQGDVGVQRRRPSRRIQGPAACRAHAAGRQEGRPDAARRRARRRDLRRREVDDPRVAQLIPNPKEAALDWYRKYNTVPVNHFFCVDKELADARPDVVAEIFRMLKETKAAMPPSPGGIDFHPVRRRGGAQAARDDHAVFGRAEDHPARVHDGRAVRRCDAEACPSSAQAWLRWQASAACATSV